MHHHLLNSHYEPSRIAANSHLKFWTRDSVRCSYVFSISQHQDNFVSRMKPCVPQNRRTGELPTFTMRLLQCWDTSYTSQQTAAESSAVPTIGPKSNLEKGQLYRSYLYSSGLPLHYVQVRHAPFKFTGFEFGFTSHAWSALMWSELNWLHFTWFWFIMLY